MTYAIENKAGGLGEHGGIACHMANSNLTRFAMYFIPSRNRRIRPASMKSICVFVHALKVQDNLH
jgi:hypothetical protein